MSTAQNYKDFPGDFGPVKVGLNHLNHDKPRDAIYIKSSDNGRPTAISREDALKLADHLRDLVVTFDALKPKEPTTVDKIKALPAGSIFTTLGHTWRYVKLADGKALSLDLTEDTYSADSWSYARGINVLYRASEVQ